MQEYDVIIIGAGLGGLTAGAKLAKSGKKILLVEQHNKLGGCATTFSRKVDGKKVVFEVGLHLIDGLDSEFDPKKTVFQDLGVYSNVDFVRASEFYRFINSRVDVTVPFNPNNAIAALLEVFPNEKRAIETFYHDIKEIFGFLVEGNLEKLASVSQMTLGNYLDNLTSNEDLKLTLAANLGYYHDNPYTLSLIFFSAPQNSYFIGGGHYIKGGSQVLSDYLGKVITDNRGTIIRKHLVTEIITKEDTAIGVKYVPTKLKNLKESEEHTVFAKIILANTAIPNIVNHLVPSLHNTKYQREVNSLEPACSILTVFLAFSRSPATLGNKAYSTFISPKNLTTLKELRPSEKSDDFQKKGFVFADYSLIDSQLNEEGVFTGTLGCIDYLDHWDNLKDVDYNAKKKHVSKIFIERLNTVIPGIKNIITFCEVATPKTLLRYTLNPAGTAYGFAQIPDQVGPRRTKIRKPPIKNLYCASAWTRSGGFSGVILAGYSCALKILKDSR